MCSMIFDILLWSMAACVPQRIKWWRINDQSWTEKEEKRKLEIDAKLVRALKRVYVCERCKMEKSQLRIAVDSTHCATK